MRKSLWMALCAGLFAGNLAAAERSGEEIFKATCQMCHAAGVAGAPKLGDKTAWAPRIKQGKSTLYAHAVGGIRSMPPKGTCMNCSEGEIRSAVDYMVSKSK